MADVVAEQKDGQEAGAPILSALQQQSFDSFGFLIIPGFLAESQVQALREAVTALKCAEAKEPDPLLHRGRVLGMFHKHPLLALFDEPRLLAIAQQLLRCRETLRFLGDEYVSYSTPADWHPDIDVGLPFEALKFGFYLDDLSRGGCLRVVPGSHHPGFYEAVAKYRQSATPKPECQAAHPCQTQPGDLLIFNLKLWHQGTANPPGTHRRVIFWSVGQDHPKFRVSAHHFHKVVGRGDDSEPWPEAILAQAPPARRQLLSVYDPPSPKALVPS